MAIKQGDIYWITLDAPNGSEPGIAHPHVVIQDDVLNRSPIDTLVVCALTTNVKRAKYPGNVLLDVGEANLPKQSIAMVSRISRVNRAQLGEYIGSLNRERVDQILAGMRFVQSLIEHHQTGEERSRAHHADDGQSV